jgi:hypothetical protein
MGDSLRSVYNIYYDSPPKARRIKLTRCVNAAARRAPSPWSLDQKPEGVETRITFSDGKNRGVLLYLRNYTSLT